MRLNSSHQAVVIDPARHPVPLVFEPVGDGRYEGEVPDDVGRFLLSMGRNREYVEVLPEGERIDEPDEAAPLGTDGERAEPEELQAAQPFRSRRRRRMTIMAGGKG